MYGRDAIDLRAFGGYDSFIDYIFDYSHNAGERHYIDDVIAEMQSWPCYKAPQSKPSKHVSVAPKPKKPGRNAPCPCGSGKKYKICCMAAEENTALSQSARDKDMLLKEYPSLQKGNKSADVVRFADFYSAEAIAMDIPVYKALHHRYAPAWIPRDQSREELTKVDFLLEAFALFTQTCQQENITSFVAFDAKYMVHYRSGYWIGALERLLTEHQNRCSERQRGYLSRVQAVVKRFQG